MSADLDAVEGLPKQGDLIAGKYAVEGTLGAGGMGVVLAARHVALGQRVAIKFLLPEVARKHPEAVERFVREARAVTLLKSEHVARVIDVTAVESDSGSTSAYLVMEFLDGQDLAKFAHGSTPPPVASVVDYVLQAAEALAEAHLHGLVHRDLKPSNLFLTTRVDGSPLVKVLDFGISKTPTQGERGITRTDAVMGSPGYMSPEQIRSAKHVDQRADVWGLGVVLYELLSGQPPFDGDNVATLSAQIVLENPKPIELLRPAVPKQLADVAMRCLEKDRTKRYQSMAELAEALVPFAPPAAALIADRIRRMGGTAAPHAQTIAAKSRSSVENSATEIAPGSAAGIAQSSPTPPTAARTDGNWERPRPPQNRSALVALAGAVLLAVVVAAFVLGRETRDEPAEMTTEASTEHVLAAPAPEPAASPTPAVSSSGAPNTIPAAAEELIAPAPSATLSADRARAPTKPRANRPTGPAPCPKGHARSEGRCCPLGLVWLAGKCDRPIATSLP